MQLVSKRAPILSGNAGEGNVLATLMKERLDGAHSIVLSTITCRCLPLLVVAYNYLSLLTITCCRLQLPAVI